MFNLEGIKRNSNIFNIDYESDLEINEILVVEMNF